MAPASRWCQKVSGVRYFNFKGLSLHEEIPNAVRNEEVWTKEMSGPRHGLFVLIPKFIASKVS